MEYIKPTYNIHKEMDTIGLWNELIEIDKKIAVYSILSREENGRFFDVELQKNLDKQFLNYIQKSLTVIEMLKKKPKEKILLIYNTLKGKYRADRKYIRTHLCFLEKVLL